MGNSFQYPLPWEQCPVDTATNDTGVCVCVCYYCMHKLCTDLFIGILCLNLISNKESLKDFFTPLKCH